MISFLLFLLLGFFLLAVFALRLLGRIILLPFFPWIRPSDRPFSQKEERPKREGSVSIDYVPPRQDLKDSRPGSNAPDSDYVDYEEVKQ